MKNIFIILLLFVVKIAFAQSNIGFIGGVNIANQKPAYTLMVNGQNKNINGETIVNFSAGMFTDISINKDFIIRPQSLYSGEGFKHGYVVDNLGNEILEAATFKLSYIEVPVQLLYRHSFSFGNLFIGSGPYASVLFAGKINSHTVDRGLKIGNKQTDDFKRFDFGLYNSGGIEFKNGLFIGVGYQLGLTKVTMQGENKNYVLSFFIGYHLNLKTHKSS